MTVQKMMRIAAVVSFGIAAFVTQVVSIGSVGFALVPFGLMLWLGSEFIAA